MLNVYINIAMYMCTVDCDTLSIFIQPNNSHIIAIGNPYPALPCPSLPFLALPRPPSTGGVWFISAKACSWAGGGWPPPGRPNRRLGSWSRWSVLYNCGQWTWITTEFMIIDVVTLKTNQLMRHSTAFASWIQARREIPWFVESHWWLSWSSARISSGVRDT